MCQVKEYGLQVLENVNAAQHDSLQQSLVQVGVSHGGEGLLGGREKWK